jgi:hypothetical protein
MPVLSQGRWSGVSADIIADIFSGRSGAKFVPLRNKITPSPVADPWTSPSSEAASPGPAVGAALRRLGIARPGNGA